MKIALFSALFVLGLVLFGGSANATHSDTYCFPLRGTLQNSFKMTDCSSPVGICTSGRYATSHGIFTGVTDFYATGLAGGVLGEASIVTPAVEPSTTWAYTGVLSIAMKLGRHDIGTLVLSDAGVLDNVAGTFAEVERPVSGTGWFEGATGRAFITGVVTPDGSGFDGVVTGEVCMPY